MRRATTGTARVRALALLLGAILALFPLLMTARPAQAAGKIFTVNETGDQSDLADDDRCDITTLVRVHGRCAGYASGIVHVG